MSCLSQQLVNEILLEILIMLVPQPLDVGLWPSRGTRSRPFSHRYSQPGELAVTANTRRSINPSATATTAAVGVLCIDIVLCASSVVVGVSVEVRELREWHGE